MNYYYDLPDEIISYINYITNNIYYEEHKKKMKFTFEIFTETKEFIDEEQENIKNDDIDDESNYFVKFVIYGVEAFKLDELDKEVKRIQKEMKIKREHLKEMEKYKDIDFNVVDMIVF